MSQIASFVRRAAAVAAFLPMVVLAQTTQPAECSAVLVRGTAISGARQMVGVLRNLYVPGLIWDVSTLIKEYCLTTEEVGLSDEDKAFLVRICTQEFQMKLGAQATAKADTVATLILSVLRTQTALRRMDDSI